MSEDFKIGCGISVVILLVIGLIVGCMIMDLGNKQSFTATITNTVIDDGMTYFILTKTDGSEMVYENNDSLVYGKFNSSDYLMKMKVGSKYTFTTIGYRIPFFSSYPNIITYDLIQ